MKLLRFVNRAGIPCLENNTVSLTSTGETFVFSRHPYIRTYFQGGIFIKISGTSAAPSTAVPIYFSTEGVSDSAVSVYNNQGVAYTTETWPGDGVYLFFWDADTEKLRLLS